MNTLVSDHFAKGNKGIGFTKTLNELSSEFKDLLDDNYILSDDGKGNKMVLWNKHSSIIIANQKEWNKRDTGVKIRFSVLFYKSPEEKALDQMGLGTVSKSIDAGTLYRDLIETYTTLGISNWVKDGAPVGLRSIVAYRHGYNMNKEFNDALGVAMKSADGWLVSNMTTVKLGEL